MVFQPNRGKGIAAPAEIAAGVRQLVEQSGTDAVALALGVSRGTVERLLAGTGIKPTSLARVTIALRGET